MAQRVQVGDAVGLIGLGVMGRGVATNLIKSGFKTYGRDVNPESLKWLESAGGIVAKDAQELAARCKVVVSFVVNDKQTEDVLFGDDGLAALLAPDSVFIACSTMSPKYVHDLASRLAERKIHLIDAPVSGGQSGALKGTLTVMLAGDPVICERMHPVLSSFGGKIFQLGSEHGKGSQMKVINQLLCGVHIAAAAEALSMAQQSGLPLDISLEVLKSGAASSWMLGDRGPRMVAQDFDTVMSAVDIFVKDMSLVLDSAREGKFPASMAHAAYLQYIKASGDGFGKLDDSAVMLNYIKK